MRGRGYPYGPSVVSVVSDAEAVSSTDVAYVDQYVDEIAVDLDYTAPSAAAACSGGGTVASSTDPSAGASLASVTSPIVYCTIQTDSGEKVYGFGDIPVGTTFIEGRLLAMSPIVRGLSDLHGNWETARVTIRLMDHDRTLRGLKATGELRNKRVDVYAIDLTALAAGSTPWRLGQFVIRKYFAHPGLEFSLECEDYFGSSVSEFALTKLIPQRTFTTDDFPNLLNEQANDASPGNPALDQKAVPIIYGSVSDEGYADSATGAPTLTGTAGRGSYLDTGSSPSLRIVGKGDLSPAATVSDPTSVTLTATGSGNNITTDVPDSKYGVLAQAQDSAGNWTDPVAFYTDQDGGGARGTFQAGVATATVSAGQKLVAACAAVTGAVKYRFTLFYYYYGARGIMYVESATPSVDFTTFTTTFGDEIVQGDIQSGAVLANQVAGFRLYRVRAIMSDGATAYSSSGWFRHQGTLRPSYVEWNAVGSAIRYEVEASDDFGSTWTRRWTTTNTYLQDNFDDVGVTIIGVLTETGACPLHYTGLRTIGSESWYEFVLCGHAVKNIQSLFGPNTGLTARERISTADTDFLIPGSNTLWQTYFGTTKYRDINGRRYTCVYARGARGLAAAQGKIPLAANVCGIEATGDGTGIMIDSAPRQVQHLLTNFVLQNYTSGDWLSIPTVNSYSRLNSTAFATVKTASETRVSGGYLGAFVLGHNGAQQTLRELIRDICLSFDIRLGINRHGQILAVMQDPTLAATLTLTDINDILDRTFEPNCRFEDTYNRVLYRYKRRYVKPVTQPTPAEATLLPSGLRQETTDWYVDNQETDNDSSITNLGETKTFDLSLPLVRDSATADNVAAKVLARQLDPVWAPMKTDLRGTAVELGQLVALTHFEGLTATGYSAAEFDVARLTIDPNPDAMTVEIEGQNVSSL